MMMMMMIINIENIVTKNLNFDFVFSFFGYDEITEKNRPIFIQIDRQIFERNDCILMSCESKITFGKKEEDEEKRKESKKKEI